MREILEKNIKELHAYEINAIDFLEYDKCYFDNTEHWLENPDNYAPNISQLSPEQEEKLESAGANDRTASGIVRQMRENLHLFQSAGLTFEQAAMSLWEQESPKIGRKNAEEAFSKFPSLFPHEISKIDPNFLNIPDHPTTTSVKYQVSIECHD